MTVHSDPRNFHTPPNRRCCLLKLHVTDDSLGRTVSESLLQQIPKNARVGRTVLTCTRCVGPPTVGGGGRGARHEDRVEQHRMVRRTTLAYGSPPVSAEDVTR